MIKIQKEIVSENRALLKFSGDNKAEILGELYRIINHGNSISIRKGTEIESETGISWLNILETEGYSTIDIFEFIKTLQAIELNKLAIKTQNERQISNKMKKRSEYLGVLAWNNIPEGNVLKDGADIEIELTGE